jgi:hypothetical protein
MRRALEALVMERQTEGKAAFPPFAQQLIDRGKHEGRTEEAEKDPARLERWHERAVVAASVADVIDDPS